MLYKFSPFYICFKFTAVSLPQFSFVQPAFQFTLPTSTFLLIRGCNAILSIVCRFRCPIKLAKSCERLKWDTDWSSSMFNIVGITFAVLFDMGTVVIVVAVVVVVVERV